MKDVRPSGGADAIHIESDPVGCVRNGLHEERARVRNVVGNKFNMSRRYVCARGHTESAGDDRQENPLLNQVNHNQLDGTSNEPLGSHSRGCFA
jgi:hypothetical protein